MERESFENVEVAAFLNAHFIPIKIDREERPDIDRIYMNYVQASTGHGGWPLNVFLTPDLEPVFGGTYWPGPTSQSVTAGGHPGFLGILEKVSTLWETQRERCLVSAKGVTDQLREFAQEGNLGRIPATTEGSSAGDVPELELLDEAYQHFENKYDSVHAGFGKAPKFPTPANLQFLILLGQFTGPVKDVIGSGECDKAKAMVLKTLRNMVRGGIHDQVGSGFARYSVTQDWSLPHFEKMLYDQSQLLSTYLDIFLVTGDPEMLGAVYDIASYLTEPPFAAPEGGFFSSEDADSLYRPSDTEKREGAFYVWTAKEIREILGEKHAAVVGAFYNVQENGNVSPEHDAHDELLNQNVLAVVKTPDELAKANGMTKDEVVQILKSGRAKLRAHREKERPRPLLDDKIVVGWNGLAIGALARAFSVLESIPGATQAAECREAAVRAAAFLKRSLYDSATGQMTRVYREGRGEAPAFADDYAFLIQGLIELYEATFDDDYLEWADTLQKTQIALFWDKDRGGFYATQEGQADILMRLKDGMDNAEPSTNGVSATNLYRLGSMLDDESYLAKASETIQAFAAELGEHPYLFTTMMSGVVARRLGMRSVVVCGEGDEVEDAIRRSRLALKPNTTVVRLGGGAKSEWLCGRNSLVKAMDASKKSVQVCEGGQCTEVLGVAELARTVREGSISQ